LIFPWYFDLIVQLKSWQLAVGNWQKVQTAKKFNDSRVQEFKGSMVQWFNGFLLNVQDFASLALYPLLCP
jgi:hypothetical protein